MEVIKEATILSLAAVLLGLTVNVLSPSGIPLDRCYQPPAPPSDSPFPIMDVSQVKDLLDSGSGVIVDARPAEQYKISHIPGACSLPVYQMDEYLFPFLDTVPPDNPVVTYCSSLTCEDSHLLARELSEMGYSDVRIFAGGMAAWREKGYAFVAQ
jgi:rhodanese-related sulfurtransferase